jgi:ABC-type amino acid transport substrate-binding protein
MRDFFNSRGISYEPVAFEKADEVVAAYDAGRCDTYTTDKSGLAAQRTFFPIILDYLKRENTYALLLLVSLHTFRN